jgi:hypothetical protein
MRIKTTRSMAAALLLILLHAPRPGHAQEASASPPRSERLLETGPTDEEAIANGIELRKAGEDEAALAEFERAYALRPSPRCAAQIALARQALGEWVAGERALLEALGAGTDPWVARNRGYLEASLAAIQEHVGVIEVEADVDGAEVWVDGVLRGRLPIDGGVRVAEGEVAVELRTPRFPAAHRTVRVQGKSRVQVLFTFANDRQEAVIPLEAPLPTTVTATAGSRPVVTAAASGEAPGPPPVAAAHPSPLRTAGWVVLGAGGVLALGGTAALVVRDWEATLYNDDARCGPLIVGGVPETRYDRCKTNRDIGSTAETMAIVGFAGAALAASAGVVLLLGRWGHGGDHSAQGARAGCDVTGLRRGLGLACGVTF